MPLSVQAVAGSSPRHRLWDNYLSHITVITMIAYHNEMNTTLTFVCLPYSEVSSLLIVFLFSRGSSLVVSVNALRV